MKTHLQSDWKPPGSDSLFTRKKKGQKNVLSNVSSAVAQMHLHFCSENMLALSGHYAIILGILPGTPPLSLQANAGSGGVGDGYHGGKDSH